MAMQKIEAPVDRPLSKAYLRQFSGWSTAYPPGTSEPNSLRLMENVWIDRNGAVQVRPGLHYLSYTTPPDLDVLLAQNPGEALGMVVVGAPELFYTREGDRALLFAVREANGEVGFRTVLFSGSAQVVHNLTDPEIGFTLPQGEDVLKFTEGTKHVEYLQINNRIVALSDNGEAARMFFVGGQKIAKKLKAISVPEWQDDHKLEAMHPDAAWINDRLVEQRYNDVLNPSFEIGTAFWTKSPGTSWSMVEDPSTTEGSGGWALEIASAPERSNLYPLTLSTGATTGWHAWENTSVGTVGGYLQVSGIDTFQADGPKALHGINDWSEYRVAMDYSFDEGATPYVSIHSYAANGMHLGSQTITLTGAGGRWTSDPFTPSTGGTSLRLSLGGTEEDGEPVSVRFKNIVLCPDGESTDYFDGDSGTDYYWEGAAGSSPSTYHPPQDLWVRSQPMPIRDRDEVRGGFNVRKLQGDAADCTTAVLMYKPDLNEIVHRKEFAEGDINQTWQSSHATGTSLAAAWVSAAVSFEVAQAARGQAFRVDCAILEYKIGGDESWFDGSTPSTSTKLNSWTGLLTSSAHESPSSQQILSDTVALAPETPTANTLVSSDNDKNEYKIGFFYTFQNEIGESAPSRVTELRMQHPWSNWRWETPNDKGEPSGTYTDVPELVADQIVVRMPEKIYDQAIAEGALRWNLYAMAWSDQEPVPVEAALAYYKDINSNEGTEGSAAVPYSVGGYIQVTPQRTATQDSMILPSADSRVNSSIPPNHRNGTVAGDRMILVGSPDDSATIAWSSNQAGLYTMFSPNRGGGRKTLTTGNLNLPYSVVLWQNPQSVDTITILCSDDNGRSNSYYMAPSTIQAGGAGIYTAMGFEETTSTPGTVAPYGAEVLNNALYRPLDRHLVKSTANNYNINHKSMTDNIANMWWLLESKQWIMSAQLDNRLYYLVHNPEGEPLAQHCKGNEIWIYDITAEKGHWSRFTIQGSALHPFTVGTRTYMGISTPDGVFYLNEDKLLDDFVDLDGKVRQRPIPWRLETNTQGANRAHDAWAHLQQMAVTFGNWTGSARYGLRGQNLYGRKVNLSKIFHDEGWDEAAQRWDVQDVLLVRHDMMEWYFYAESLTGVQGTGQISVVQYRYTPTTVNVGYEFGSIETFEYGIDKGGEGTEYSRNGIPRPYVDYDRP